jgi:hypothetical protein
VAGIIFYSVIVEPQWIQLSRYDIAIPNLPKSFEGFSILHLSDFHGRVGAFSYLQRNKISADVIVITGDLFSWITLPRKRMAWALDTLQAPNGVFYVSGNHDYHHGKLNIEPWDVDGRLLDNRAISVNRAGDAIWFAGIPDLVKGKPSLASVANQIPDGAIAILLSHRPDAVLLPQSSRFNLILSGHTHGGQVTFGGRWAPVRHTRVGRKYVAGKWMGPGNTILVTSRGLGESELPIRFGSRPEVVQIFLYRA